MRMPRIKCPEQTSLYHCTSRIHGYIPFLDDLEKQHLLRLVEEFEVFSDVEVLSYCLMDNHFHIVVSVPPRPQVLPSVEDIMKRLEGLTLVHHTPESVARELRSLRKRGDLAGEQKLLDGFHHRMWDVSEFMKSVKENFSTWHIRRHKKDGPVWKGRFHSVLVELGEGLLATSAYVDLNPVRAGMVSTPESHPWNGYAAAMGGSAKRREGIRKVVSAWAGREVGLTESLELYRCQIYLRGEERRDATGRVVRLGLSRSEVLAMVAQQGVVELSEYLVCRVRYFTRGLALGTQEYVEEVFRRHRQHFSPRRASGARPLAGLKPGALYSLRAYARGALS